jgi:hypothetical protein
MATMHDALNPQNHQRNAHRYHLETLDGTLKYAQSGVHGEDQQSKAMADRKDIE